MNVGDLKDETEAKKSLPSMVTLLVDNKKIKDVTAKIKNGAFDGNTAGSYTFVGTVKIPEGTLQQRHTDRKSHHYGCGKQCNEETTANGHHCAVWTNRVVH